MGDVKLGILICLGILLILFLRYLESITEVFYAYIAVSLSLKYRNNESSISLLVLILEELSWDQQINILNVEEIFFYHLTTSYLKILYWNTNWVSLILKEVGKERSSWEVAEFVGIGYR